MTGLFLIYDARQEGALNRLLSELSEKAGEIGAVVKVAEAGSV
jgi:hypothetical protein